jgi:hypothetical protein
LLFEFQVITPQQTLLPHGQAGFVLPLVRAPDGACQIRAVPGNSAKPMCNLNGTYLNIAVKNNKVISCQKAPTK